MTRDDTKELLMSIKAIYPNFNIKPEEMTVTINAWHLMLNEYPKEAVNAALQIYVKTNNSGFAPSVSQLIGAMYAPKSNNQLSEGEAWNLVKKAIQNGNYGAETEFEKLPQIVQRAVGSPNMIRQWAQSDTDEVNTVIASNFQRTYKAVLSKQEFGEKVPEQLADIVNLVADKVSGQKYLEGSE